MEKGYPMILAFYIESERIECVNPIQVEPAKMGEINKIIQDIQNNFDIGNGADEDIDNSDNNVNLNK